MNLVEELAKEVELKARQESNKASDAICSQSYAFSFGFDIITKGGGPTDFEYSSFAIRSFT